MKKWRFLGVDDSFNEKKCCMVGCVTCDGYVEGFLYTEIEIDGLDATDKLIGMVKRSKFREQIKCIFLPGITFGGSTSLTFSEFTAKPEFPLLL